MSRISTIGVIFLLTRVIWCSANELETAGNDLCANVFRNSTHNVACSPFAGSEVLNNIMQDIIINNELNGFSKFYDFINNVDSQTVDNNSRRFHNENDFTYNNTFEKSTNVDQYGRSTTKWTSNVHFHCELDKYPKPMGLKRFYIYRNDNKIPDVTNVKMVLVKGFVRFYKEYNQSNSYENSIIKLRCKDKTTNLFILPGVQNVGLHPIENATFNLRHEVKYYDEPHNILMPAAFTINTTISFKPYLKEMGIYKDDIEDIIQNVSVKVTSRSYYFNSKLNFTKKLIVVDRSFVALVDDMTNYVVVGSKQTMKNVRLITTKVVYPSVQQRIRIKETSE